MKEFDSRHSDNPQALIGIIKGAIRDNGNSFLKAILATKEMQTRLPECAQTAVYYGNLEMLKFLHEELLLSLTDPPLKIPIPEKDHQLQSEIDYLPAPYIIQAAARGHVYFTSFMNFK